jgi:lipopolysaccharide assembly outer membrane protein LptD (OstA)
VLKGKVKIRYKGIEIQGEEIRIDNKAKIIEGAGGFTFTQINPNTLAEEKIKGETFFYRLEEKKATLNNIYLEISTEDPNQKMYIKACCAVSLNQEKYFIKDATFTSCNFEEKDFPVHYYIKAKFMEVIPKDRVVAYNIIFYLQGVPVLWLPIWIIDLKRERFQGAYYVGKGKRA